MDHCPQSDARLRAQIEALYAVRGGIAPMPNFCFQNSNQGENLWSTYHTLVSADSTEGQIFADILEDCTHLPESYRRAHPAWLPLIALAHELAREPRWSDLPGGQRPVKQVLGFYTDANRDNLADIQKRMALAELHVRWQCEGMLADMSGAVEIAEEAHEKAMDLLVARNAQHYDETGLDYAAMCGVTDVIEQLWLTVRAAKRTPWLRMLQERLASRARASIDAAVQYDRLRRLLRDAKQRRARRSAKLARQMLRELQAPADDARGATYTPYERNLSGLVQMEPEVFRDIVLPQLTAQAAAALQRTCREFSGLNRLESKGTQLRAMVPQFRVRWLPGKLRAGHQSEGVLPHCKMKSRDAFGRQTVVNCVYSERLVHVVVDFGSWIPRHTKLVPGLRGRLGRRNEGRVPLGLAEPHPDPSLAGAAVGVLPADHPLRVAPHPPAYLNGDDHDSDDDNNGGGAPANPLLAGYVRRARRQKNVRKHWLRHDETTPSQRAPLDADKAFVRVPTNRFFVGQPIMFATLVDAETLEDVDDSQVPKLALSEQRNGGPYSFVNPQAAARWDKYQQYIATSSSSGEAARLATMRRRRNVRLFKAPERIVSSRDDDADAVAMLPAKLLCNVTPPKHARSHDAKGRKYKIAVHIRGVLREGYDHAAGQGDVYETTVYSDSNFESLSRKKIVRARGVV